MKSITPKERVGKAFIHQAPDHVPYNMVLLNEAEKKLKQAWPDVKDIYEKIGNHLAMFEASTYSLFRQKKVGDRRYIDAFGAIWELAPGDDIGTVIEHPMKEPSLKGYEWPDPVAICELEPIPPFMEKHSNKFIIAALGFTMFERMWILRGVDNALADFLLYPRFTHELMDRILEFNLEVIDILCQYPVDCFHIGDDWGRQSGLMMGPDIWREFFKPRFKIMYERAKKRGFPISIHSCGDISEIIPDLIEIGVNQINPVQEEAMDIRFLKKEYGRDLVFWGGISTQELLPKASPQDVKEEMRRIVDFMNVDGGYILSPSHEVQRDVPVENILAFIEQCHEFAGIQQ